jgi:hypothetical protein
MNLFLRPVLYDLVSLRRVLFDLLADGEPMIVGLESLEQAVASFFHLCIGAHVAYPQVEK